MGYNYNGRLWCPEVLLHSDGSFSLIRRGQELKDYFPEFRKYEDKCRFQGCRHLHEPDCAVREALEREEISSIRYEDYKNLWQELAEKRKY